MLWHIYSPKFAEHSTTNFILSFHTGGPPVIVNVLIVSNFLFSDASHLFRVSVQKQ